MCACGAFVALLPAQPNEPHIAPGAVQRQSAPGLLGTGAIEVDDADIVGLDNHAQFSAIGFGQDEARRGDAMDRLAYLDPARDAPVVFGDRPAVNLRVVLCGIAAVEADRE